MNPEQAIELVQDAAPPPSDAEALAGFLAVVLCAITAPLCIAVVRRIFPGRNVVFARWGFSHALAAFTVGLAATFASMGLVDVLARFVPVHADGIVAGLLRGVFITGMVAAYAARTAERVEPDGERALGLRTDRLPRAIGAGVLVYVWFLPALAGLFRLWPWLLARMGETFEQQAELRLLPGLEGWQLGLFVVCAVVVIPLLEEVVFRSFLQPLLVQNLNEPAGVAMTSFVFAALHGTGAFLPVFALSLVLGAVMLRTQRLAAVWTVHALHNGLMVVLTLAATS